MTKGRTNWTGVLFGLSLSFLAAFQLFKLPPVLPTLLDVYGYERTLAGAFMSVYALAGLSLSVLVGRLLERLGPARPVLAALALMVAGNILVLLWPGQGLLVLGARTLEGVGFAVLAIAGPAMANREASPRDLPLIIGLTATWIPAGQLAAGLMTPASLALGAWQILWIVALAASVLLALWTAILARGNRVALGPQARGDPASTSSRSSGGRIPLDLLLAAAIFMLWSGQFFAYMTWLPQYLVEVHGLTVSLALAGYMLPVVVLMAFNVITGALLRAGVALGPLMAAALVAQASVWWLHPGIGGGWGGIAALTVYGIGAGITPTCLFALPSAIVGARRAAPAFGVLMTGRNLGVLIGPILLAQAFELAGSWQVSAPIFGSLTAVAVVIAVVVAFRASRR